MNDAVSRQQRRFMGYNLVAFTLIFTLFGLILYGQIRSSLFGPVEESIQKSRDIILSWDDYIERQLTLPSDRAHAKPNEKHTDPAIAEPPGEPPDGEPRNFGGGKQNVPMRIQTVLRSQSGEILNPRALGRLYYDDYLDEIPFTPADSGESSTFQMGDSTYITLTFSQQHTDGQTYYIQLLSSLDGEKSVLDHFVRMLIVCIVVFVLLSITASYLLSRVTMAPLVRSWKRQTEFVEDASHELRTPLTIIQNKLETMLTTPQATVMQKAEDIGVSLSETRRLSKLTADLMTLARADSGETQLEKIAFPLDALIAEVSAPYRELAEMQDKQMTLSLAHGGEIVADRARVHQLMVILLDNALKYTGEGEHIDIRTACRDERAVIEVADTGIGIPEESLERIFDRFYRTDKARGRALGGSGLGLSIAKWIVSTHAGAIVARKNEGRGVVFRVTLPPSPTKRS